MKFYFDYISPNAYIAWKEIGKLAKRFDQTIEPIPVLFAGLLKASERSGPAEIPLVRRWMFKNVLRKCAELDVPFAVPASHPFNPLLALRVTATNCSELCREALIETIFDAVWAKGQDVTDRAVVAELLTVAGLDSEECLSEAGSQEVKDRIRENTQAAFEEGVFGVPTVIVDDELFWGYDDFHYLERRLAGKDEFSAEEFEAFLAVSATAQRRAL